MNAKEAKEIIKGHKNKACEECFELTCVEVAEIYLSALNGPEVSLLVEALENCSRWYRLKGDEEGRAGASPQGGRLSW